jgi:hypothetical protein
MKKFRIDASTVEAIQFTNENKDQVFNSVTCNRYPDYEDDDITPVLVIQTSSGENRVHLGDWVIKDHLGNFTSCKAGLFETLYHEEPLK